MKKYISSLLIVCMLNLFSGCYYQKQITNPQSYKFDEQLDIELTTRDTTHNLKGEDYYCKNETLNVTLSKNLNEYTKFIYDVKIPTKEIQKVEVTYFDSFDTTIGLFGIVAFVGIVMALDKMSKMWK